MYIYNKNKITLECLDYYRHETEYRIKVKAWKNLGNIREQFFISSHSMMHVFNYVGEIGMKEVVHKIISRIREENRNKKFLACGIGEVIEVPAGQEAIMGQQVCFIAANHPAVPERIVVPEELMEKTDISLNLMENEYIFSDRQENERILNRTVVLGGGWNLHSGYDLKSYGGQIRRIFQDKNQINWGEENKYTKAAVSNINEMNYHISIDGRIKKGVIFGLGNYAKTNIIPKIENKIKLLTIHEIDPTQIHKSYVKKYNVDTSEMLRDSEKYDAYFIAGYHHMHNQISLEAIMNNAYAVVEKPVVTSSQQLEELLTALKNNKGKLISCFQKRYSPLNKYIFQDFQRDTDDRPISYHCIIYEVKLPQFHWYTWPNSKSRLISNGCHWIDHFFYLNQYCDYLATDVCIAENGQLNCTIELKNGAFFTMALFDEGSHRIGMQEYIWLTAGDTTATILNSSKYCSENHKKVIRKVKVNKIEAYKTMYRCIAKTITDNGSGDEIHTIEVLWNAVFELETKYQEIIKNRAVGKNE